MQMDDFGRLYEIDDEYGLYNSDTNLGCIKNCRKC